MTVSARASTDRWQPRVYFWDGGFMGIGRGPEQPTAAHSHHAFVITISLENEIAFSEHEGVWRELPGAVVLPDRPHAFDARGQLIAVIFMDPETREGLWLGRSLREVLNPVLPAKIARELDTLRRFWSEPLGADETARLVLDSVRGMCVGPPPIRRLDERIVRAIAIVRRLEAPRIRLGEVADAVFLSPSRFKHLFREEVGLPFRRYVLWRKLTRALVGIARGATLSEAAHASGFADSAHLNRTFHQMLGASPTSLFAGGEFFEIPAPFDVATETSGASAASHPS
jgi:AraC family transcriptional regulator